MPERGTLDISKAKKLIGYNQLIQLKKVISNTSPGIKNFGQILKKINLNLMNKKKNNFKNNVLIVAEIGNNHEGSFNLAKKLIVKAAQSGVDAVNFKLSKRKNL